jgi:hypothetical protein
MTKDYKNYVEKFILTLILGALKGIQSGVLSIYEAERLIFTPEKLMWVDEQLKLDNDIFDIIHAATELVDIKNLVPHEFDASLMKMLEKAEKCLKKRPCIAFDTSTLDQRLLMQKTLEKKMFRN